MTVLVVDDEPVVRNLLIRSISAAGYYVLEAASGAEATQLAQSFPGPIHLAIIDHILENRRRGMDVAAEIAAIQPGIRLLLISGMLEEDALNGLSQANFRLEFLQKPFSTRTLLDRIRQMLAHYDCCW